jgi:hypothetical protein
MRSASAKLSAPTGAIMNSWKSIALSAWAPPLTMFISGTGSGAHRRRRHSATAAARRPRPPPRRAQARLTPSVALAPSRALLGVPSSSISAWSMASCSSRPCPDRPVEDLAQDGVDRPCARPCRRSGRVAVAQLDRLVRAGRGARGHRGAARAVPDVEADIDLDGRIAAAVENLARLDVDDGGHGQAAPRAGAPMRTLSCVKSPPPVPAAIRALAVLGLVAALLAVAVACSPDANRGPTLLGLLGT